MNEQSRRRFSLLFLFAAAAVAFAPSTLSIQGCAPSIVAPARVVTSVTYVYEKDDTGSVPSGVLVGLDKLNRSGVRATAFEKDSKDGNGETPDQYKLPLQEATKAGLPALVSLAEDEVHKVIRDPKTEEQVMEAAQ